MPLQTLISKVTRVTSKLGRALLGHEVGDCRFLACSSISSGTSPFFLPQHPPIRLLQDARSAMESLVRNYNATATGGSMASLLVQLDSFRRVARGTYIGVVNCSPIIRVNSATCGAPRKYSFAGSCTWG